jgi:hypothetical protein
VIDGSDPGWEIGRDEFGGQLVRHRHGGVPATEYLYSNPDEAWAECTMCGAKRSLGPLGLDGRAREKADASYRGEK